MLQKKNRQAMPTLEMFFYQCIFVPAPYYNKYDNKSLIKCKRFKSGCQILS